MALVADLVDGCVSRVKKRKRELLHLFKQIGGFFNEYLFSNYF